MVSSYHDDYRSHWCGFFKCLPSPILVSGDRSIFLRAFGFIIALNLSRDKVNFKSYFTWMIATAFLSEISFTLFEPNYDRLNVLFQFLSVIGVIWVYKNRQDLNSWVMFFGLGFFIILPHSLIMVYLGFYIALVVTYSCKQKILNFVLLRC